MVGVARIELATPAMSTQCQRKKAQFSAPSVIATDGTVAEHSGNRAKFHRNYTGAKNDGKFTRTARYHSGRMPLPVAMFGPGERSCGAYSLAASDVALAKDGLLKPPATAANPSNWKLSGEAWPGAGGDALRQAVDSIFRTQGEAADLAAFGSACHQAGSQCPCGSASPSPIVYAGGLIAGRHSRAFPTSGCHPSPATDGGAKSPPSFRALPRPCSELNGYLDRPFSSTAKASSPSNWKLSGGALRGRRRGRGADALRRASDSISHPQCEVTIPDAPGSACCQLRKGVRRYDLYEGARSRGRHDHRPAWLRFQDFGSPSPRRRGEFRLHPSGRWPSPAVTCGRGRRPAVAPGPAPHPLAQLGRGGWPYPSVGGPHLIIMGQLRAMLWGLSYFGSTRGGYRLAKLQRSWARRGSSTLPARKGAGSIAGSFLSRFSARPEGSERLRRPCRICGCVRMRTQAHAQTHIYPSDTSTLPDQERDRVISNCNRVLFLIARFVP